MSYSDDTQSEQEWKNTKKFHAAKLKNKSTNKTKYAQKFLEKWIKIFDPWLERCKDDENKAFCKACQTRLDANRCHLQRHEGTSKHARNLEILINKGENCLNTSLSIRKERSKYYRQQQRTKVPEPEDQMDVNTAEGYTEEDDELNSHENVIDAHEEVYMEEAIVKEEYAEKEVVEMSPHKHKREQKGDALKLPKTKRERNSLLLQIQRDKNDLIETFKELISSSGLNAALQQQQQLQPQATQILQQQQPAQEKNHIDLFFESVSSSVKALTPKLIAEAKMRVSQLIGELELRALTELENQQQQQQIAVSSQNNQSYVIN